MRNPNAPWSGAGRRRTPLRRGGAFVMPVLLALVIAPAPAAAVSLDLPPASASVDVLAVNGPGCAMTDQVTAELSPDNTHLTVTYHGFRAQSGAGALPLDFRKQCQLSLVVSHPPEITVGITDFELAGQVRVATGASATVRSGHHWEANAFSLDSETMAGPLEGGWHVAFVPGVPEPIMEGCGRSRALRLVTELRVTAGTSDPAEGGFIALADGPDTPSASYHLYWQECPPPAMRARG